MLDLYKMMALLNSKFFTWASASSLYIWAWSCRLCACWNGDLEILDLEVLAPTGGLAALHLSDGLAGLLKVAVPNWFAVPFGFAAPKSFAALKYRKPAIFDLSCVVASLASSLSTSWMVSHREIVVLLYIPEGTGAGEELDRRSLRLDEREMRRILAWSSVKDKFRSGSKERGELLTRTLFEVYSSESQEDVFG